MKIAHKIILLVLLALLLLGLNTGVALYQLNHLRQELSKVAGNDVALMGLAHQLSVEQLEQKLLLEKLKSVAEELGNDQINETRRAYLKDYLKGLHDLGGRLSGQVDVTVAKAALLLNEEKLKLEDIKRAYHQYQGVIVDLSEAIEAGQLQLSFEHLDSFSQREALLEAQIKDLVEGINRRLSQSLKKSQALQEQTKQILWLILGVSILVCGCLAFFIIFNIQDSLNVLVKATQKIGHGDFNLKLSVQSNDEVAKLAKAFNAMSDQLQVFKQKLEAKNIELEQNWQLTKEQKRDLEKVNKELDRFVHTASHDILGPLTSIVGYAAYLESHYLANLDQKGKDALSGVRKGATRLDNLIKDLLELTRINRVKNPYLQTPVAEIVHTALSHHEFKIQELKAKVDIQGVLPVIVADRIKLTAIFINLIGNAIKYSSKNNPGGPRIEIGYLPEQEDHVFYVKDNGIGIPKEKHQDIFEIFARFHTDEGYEGVGAGLAIVKAAVEDHGGQITVESQPGCGASFIFTIPKTLEPYRPII